MVDRKKSGQKKAVNYQKGPSVDNDLIGMKAICDHVHRSAPTVLRLIRDMEFPARQIGGIWESSREKIEQWREKIYA